MKTVQELKVMHQEGRLVGIYGDIPIEVYHHPECPGVSKSFQDQFMKSPEHGLAYLKHKTKRTPAMILGSAIHTAVLEPELFLSSYILKPEGCDNRSKEGKAWHAEMKERGLEPIKADDYAMITGIRDSVKAHPWASQFLMPDLGLAEQTIFWIDEDTGVLCKARPDFLRHDGTIVDLKSTEDAREDGPFGFQRSVQQYRYHVQGAFFIDGATAATGKEHNGFVLISVEKKIPYGIQIFVLAKKAIERGRIIYQQTLGEIAVCSQQNSWPGYTQEPQTIDLPDWVYNMDVV